MPVSFSGGSALPAVGTPAYSAAQQGSGQGSYNPTTNTLSSSSGGILYSPNQQSPAPAVPQTTNASQLASNQSPLNLPNQASLTNPNALVSSLQTPANQTDQSQGSEPGQPTDWRKQFMSTYLGLTNEAGNEGQQFQNLQQQYQVPQMTQQLAGLRGTIAQRTAAYMQQWQQANTEHAALPYIAGEQTQIQRTQAIEIGVLSAQEQALSGNLQAANDIVNQTIQHEFQPIQTQLSALQQFYTMNKNDLTDSESMQLQQNYNIQNANYQNFLSTKTSAYQTAITYGASPQTLSALANAQSSTDVWNALSGVVSGTASQGGNIVNGYDLSTYATDPAYASKIQAASSTIGQITNIQQATDTIKQIAPNSPITGDMIATAASQYNVDPNTLMSVMAVESKFGTLGLGAKTNNPGNVGNTDSGATQKFADWQSGVNAVAQQLSSRRVTAQQAALGQTSSSKIQAITSSAPVLLQSSIRFFNGDTPYIDSSTLTDPTQKTMAASWSARNGVPVLNSQDAEALRGLETARANLDTVANNFFEVAPGSTGSGTGSNISNFLGKAYFKFASPVNQFFDTDYGSKVAAYNDNRESLIKQVNSLAGSSPRLNENELNLASNAMPTLKEFNTDTLRDGQNKLAITYQYFDNAIKTFLPNYTPPPTPTYQSYTQMISGQKPQQSSNNTVTAPDGKQIIITN